MDCQDECGAWFQACSLGLSDWRVFVVSLVSRKIPGRRLAEVTLNFYLLNTFTPSLCLYGLCKGFSSDLTCLLSTGWIE